MKYALYGLMGLVGIILMAMITLSVFGGSSTKAKNPTASVQVDQVAVAKAEVEAVRLELQQKQSEIAALKAEAEASVKVKKAEVVVEVPENTVDTSPRADVRHSVTMPPPRLPYDVAIVDQTGRLVASVNGQPWDWAENVSFPTNTRGMTFGQGRFIVGNDGVVRHNRR